MPRTTGTQEKATEPDVCPYGCDSPLGNGRTYVGQGRLEQEVHRQRAVRRAKAQTLAEQARQPVVQGVLARFDLGPANTPRVLVARLVSLAVDVAGLASLVELDVLPGEVGQAGDGWDLADGAVGPVVVVLVDPAWEGLSSV